MVFGFMIGFIIGHDLTLVGKEKRKNLGFSFLKRGTVWFGPN